jgi:2-keto-4-pentenoate hydratase
VRWTPLESPQHAYTPPGIVARQSTLHPTTRRSENSATHSLLRSGVVVSDDRIAAGMAAQKALRRQRINAGATAIGWKVGSGSSRAQSRLSLDTLLVGFLTAKSQLDSGASCSLTGWDNPALEVEVAVRLAADVGPSTSIERLCAAVGELGAAIELVDFDAGDQDVTHILANNIFHRYVIFAPDEPVHGYRCLAGLSGRVTVNGEVVATTDNLEALNGPILQTLRQVAVELGKCDESLRKDDVVICGSIVAPVSIRPGDDVIGTIDELGSVRVSFT